MHFQVVHYPPLHSVPQFPVSQFSVTLWYVMPVFLARLVTLSADARSQFAGQLQRLRNSSRQRVFSLLQAKLVHRARVWTRTRHLLSNRYAIRSRTMKTTPLRFARSGSNIDLFVAFLLRYVSPSRAIRPIGWRWSSFTYFVINQTPDTALMHRAMCPFTLVPTHEGMARLSNLGGWMRTEMVHPPADGHPSK